MTYDTILQWFNAQEDGLWYVTVANETKVHAERYRTPLPDISWWVITAWREDDMTWTGTLWIRTPFWHGRTYRGPFQYERIHSCTVRDLTDLTLWVREALHPAPEAA